MLLESNISAAPVNGAGVAEQRLVHRPRDGRRMQHGSSKRLRTFGKRSCFLTA